jgi:phage terminase large subunit
MAVLSSTGQKVINPTITAKRTMQAIQEGWPIIGNEGGSSSGKTYGTVFDLILLCQYPDIRKKILGKAWPELANRPIRVSFVSHSLPHIKRGVYRDFRINMAEIGVWNEDNWRATDFVYTYPDGSYIELFGLEDESRARGPRRDILYVNESNLISKMLFDQLAMRTVGPKLMDLNPSDFNCWCYEVLDNPKNKKLHSTYLDNIDNLSTSQIEYIESYKDLADDFMWKVYGLGQRGASKELIYTAWKLCAELPNKGEVFYGLDFGYTAPTAMVKIELYEGQLYVEEMIYQTKLTVSDIADKLKALNLSKSVEVFCDAAEPKSIEELYRAGYNAKPADKDVWGGIMKVKSYNLNVTHNSNNLKAELQSYKWQTDKNGNILADEKPVKENDHLLDAMRYGVFTKLTKPQVDWDLFQRLNK